ncbi:hypothetical protein EDB80DRAFT_723711 [Ilyonectria destructans]|nr:hypothetical protein EDB80DRAFT_723711 [Ilyonectria destructans]
MTPPKRSFINRFGPWRAASDSIQDFLSNPNDKWMTSKLAELTVVNITGALVASVVSGALSWPAVDNAPWTTKALFYSTLILSLASISAATQQSIALYRIGGNDSGLEVLQNLLKRRGSQNASRLQAYTWQMPVMLLNVGIFLFLLGLMILIWNRAAQDLTWDQHSKIAFVASLAGLFALVNYIVGAISLYQVGDTQ